MPRYLVLKDMKEAEYVADYLLGKGNKEEFMAKFSKVGWQDGLRSFGRP